MVGVIFIKVLHEESVYDYLVLTQNFICKYNQHSDMLSVYLNEHISKYKLKVLLDGILLHYMIKELSIGNNYRKSFINTLWECSKTNAVKVLLVPPRKEIIDYDWNYRITTLVQEKCELEHALSWLSTLGGAFSALGDYFERCAHTAGKISINQLKLAMRLGDASIVSRCLLYYSLSLIQCRRFKLAKKIVIGEYTKAINQSIPDTRLINMCKGIWCKLKYEMCK